jgi:hypothetical protein
MLIRDIGIVAITDIVMHLGGIACATMILQENVKWIDKQSLKGLLVGCEIFYASSIFTAVVLLLTSLNGAVGVLMFRAIILFITFLLGIMVSGNGLGVMKEYDPNFWKSDTSYVLFIVPGIITVADLILLFTTIISREKLRKFKRANPQIDYTQFTLGKLVFGEEDELVPTDVETGKNETKRSRKKPSYNNKKPKVSSFTSNSDHYNQSERLLAPTIVQHSVPPHIYVPYDSPADDFHTPTSVGSPTRPIMNREIIH